MKIVLLNIDKFVRVNDLQEITNPVILERGYIPTTDGLLSTDIFGTNMTDRKNTFGYISLNCHLLQPLVYINLKRMSRYIDDIISGTKYFKIEKNGDLVEDEAGETGIDWLYDNWEKIKWQRNDSTIRGERIDLLENHTKAEIFQDKEIVCPAFYRDINLQSSKAGRPSIHKFNHPYTKLIRLASMLNQGTFSFSLHNTKYQMQQTLVEIYNQFKERIEKKRGIIRNNLLGKSIDYGARVVISSANFTYNSVEEMPVNFYHVGIPLSYCISLFTPFFSGWIQNFFRRELELTGMKYPSYDPNKKEVVYRQIQDPMIQFNDEYIKELMHRYIRSYSQRFEPIKLKVVKDPNDKTCPEEIEMRFVGRRANDKEIDLENPESVLAARPLTLTDLFYIAAVDITKDKHVYITRYPMADYSGIFPSRIAVLSTNETMKLTVADETYSHYPVVDPNLDPSEVPAKFTEVVQMSNTYLQSIESSALVA